jgi:BirA family transcriptional regulator, biotin operon repressor / biotin---[acetyl-CoA-carboxylase] ligase
VSVPEDSPLAPARVAARLRSPGSWRLTGGGVTASTNDDAKALATSGDPGGAAVLATVQTAGRGRFDRVWESPGGGVYLSALLRPDLDPADAGTLSLAAGISVVRALRRLDASLERVLGLKWPNDVLADGGKLAGILVESSARAGAIDWVVVGVGVNVARDPDAPADGRAFVSDLTGPGSPALMPDRVAAAVLDELADRLDPASLAGDAAAGLLSEYERLSGDVGREVTVRDRAGTVTARGRVAGFDRSGRMLVETRHGVVAVASGESTLRA